MKSWSDYHFSPLTLNKFYDESYSFKNYIFEKPLKNGCRNMCHTLICVLNKKNIFTFFLAFFTTLPSTANYKSYRSNFIFQWAGLEKFGYEHAFQPFTYSLGGRPPSLNIDSNPPAFLGLSYTFYTSFVRRNTSCWSN